MGRFEAYKGKTEIEVDGEKLALDISKSEKLEILSVYKEGKNMAMDKLYEIIGKIVKKSYPQEPEDELEEFVAKRFELILIELSVYYKWTTRESINSMMGGSQKN
jgi:hypothetical protein